MGDVENGLGGPPRADTFIFMVRGTFRNRHRVLFGNCLEDSVPGTPPDDEQA